MGSQRRPPHVKLSEWWSATSSGIAVGSNDPASIAELEKRYGISLPTDFREYLICGCPQNEWSLDNELTNWWPVTRIKNITDECDSPISSPIISASANSYLFFADYSIWAWAWAICCSENEHRGKVAVIGDRDRFVAASFDEFVDLYLADFAGEALSPSYPWNVS